MSCTTPLLRANRFAAQSRVGCAIAIGDYFVLSCDEMLHCRIVKNLEARRRFFRCLWLWSIARFEAKAFWSFTRRWKSLFLDFVPLKNEFVSSSGSVEKACWQSRDHGPCTKITSSARSCLEFLQRLWIKSIKSACHWSSTPLATVRRRWKLRRTRRCKGCRDTVRWWRVCITLSISKPVTLCSVVFETKSERCS